VGWCGSLPRTAPWLRQNDQLIRLNLDPNHVQLNSPALEKKLAEALSAQFGRDIKLRIEPEVAREETPAQQQSRLARERQLAAEQSIAEDDTGTQPGRDLRCAGPARYGAAVGVSRSAL